MFLFNFVLYFWKKYAEFLVKAHFYSIFLEMSACLGAGWLFWGGVKHPSSNEALATRFWRK